MKRTSSAMAMTTEPNNFRTNKKRCFRCEQGYAVTTCEGCQRSFCMKHILEHHEELNAEIQMIGHEFNVLRERVNECFDERNSSDFIDAWERESIMKIKQAAQYVRQKHQLMMNEKLDQIKCCIHQNTNDIRSCLELEAFTESDVRIFNENLVRIQNSFEKKPSIEIIESNDPTNSIRLIEIRQNPSILDASLNVSCMNDSLEELFCAPVGKIEISDNGSTLKCLGAFWNGSSALGNKQYTQGEHILRFSIDMKGTDTPFFGIISVPMDNANRSLNCLGHYCWWHVESTTKWKQDRHLSTDRSSSDSNQLTMTIDCNRRQITFEHDPSKTKRKLNIDVNTCPLPWRIIITLRSMNDVIRILH